MEHFLPLVLSQSFLICNTRLSPISTIPDTHRRRLLNSQSHESVEQNSEHPRCLPPLHTGGPRHSSASALASSNSSLGTAEAAGSAGAGGGMRSASTRLGTRTHSDKLKGDWPLPPLRRRPVTSVPLEQARRISRSLSFLLGEPPENEPVGEEEPPPSPHMLPPLSPHMPPLLTRTVTSPHFPGQALCAECRGLHTGLS